MTRKLAALALAGVLCTSGAALAADPAYYMQARPSLTPGGCGPVGPCFNVGCNLEGVVGFQTVHIEIIVDCHKNEQFTGAFYGLAESSGGTLAIHTGFVDCPGWLDAPGAEPTSSGLASTGGCEECCSVIRTHSYLILAAAPVAWSFGANADVGSMLVLDCAGAEVAANCGGGAAINSGGAAICQCAGPTGIEDATWGSLKALYN